MPRSVVLLLTALLMTLVCVATVARADLVELTPGNFNKIVKDPSKDVFVLFYAPWCGHCNQMKPEWTMLAQKYPTSGSTIIARIDASTHKDIAARYKVEGFPTLRLFTKAEKRGIAYEGARDVASFEKFLQQHVKSS